MDTQEYLDRRTEIPFIIWNAIAGVGLVILSIATVSSIPFGGFGEDRGAAVLIGIWFALLFSGVLLVGLSYAGIRDR